MMLLPVNEMFETVQGEATWTGTPSFFIRLQGCDVGCPWCDTKHTWKLDPTKAVSMEAILSKVSDDDTYCNLTPEHLVDVVLLHKCHHVVITGGEPCEYDLKPLTAALEDRGLTTQIETSGTREILCDWRTWVTVSPKIEMPGGFKVRDDALTRASEIKMPVGKMADVDRLKALLNGLMDKPKIWLQPLSMSAKATELCIDQATVNGWRISIQTHKLLGVR